MPPRRRVGGWNVIRFSGSVREDPGWAMFLELAKFVSLLASILSLDALFHATFLEPGERLEHRLAAALEHLLQTMVRR